MMTLVRISFYSHLFLTIQTLIVNYIVMENERSTSLIKRVPFGVLQPGENRIKTLSLISTGLAGDRILDVSARSRPPGDQEGKVEGTDDEMDHDSTEILHTLTVSAVEPFRISHDVVYRRSTQEWVGLADLKTFDGDYWDSRGGDAVVNVRIECPGPWPVEIDGVVLEREVRVFDSNFNMGR
jgi:hypothetical protein